MQETNDLEIAAEIAKAVERFADDVPVRQGTKNAIDKDHPVRFLSLAGSLLVAELAQAPLNLIFGLTDDPHELQGYFLAGGELFGHRGLSSTNAAVDEIDPWFEEYLVDECFAQEVFDSTFIRALQCTRALPDICGKQFDPCGELHQNFVDQIFTGQLNLDLEDRKSVV